MQHLSYGSRRHVSISKDFRRCQAQVRFFALRRIKPHAPPLVRAPVNSFEFQPCGHTPQAGHLTLSLREQTLRRRLPSSAHRLQPGLPGYLIRFAPLAFAPQRQVGPSAPPSPPAFLPISTHFTAPPVVPRTSTRLKPASIGGPSSVEPRAFTPDLPDRLHTL